jgi:hypothetical protein
LSGADRVLVVGTYPPIPLPAARVTLAEVRRGWEAGHPVTVVSPRLSAADLMVPVAGPLAGHRLKNVQRHTNSNRLVLVIERGFPVPEGPEAVQWLTVLSLTRALKAFDHVTLVEVGSAGLAPRSHAALAAAADTVRDADDADDADDAMVGDAALPRSTAGVTPLGPSETGPLDRSRQMTVALARKMLGRHYAGVRTGLARAEQRVRAVVRT